MACLLTSAFWTRPVQADEAEAKRLFDRGVALMDKGDLERACGLLEQSYELVRGVGAQYMWARCLQKQGKLSSAWHHFREVLDVAQRAGQTERAAVAQQRLDEVEPELMRIAVDVRAPVEGLGVTVAGEALDRGSWGSALPRDPGPYTVRATAPGYGVFTTTVELVEPGATVTAVIPPAHEWMPDSDGSPTESSSGSGWLVAGIVTGGVGLVALGAAGVTTAMASATYSDSDAFCDELGCFQEGLDLVDEARRLGDATTGLVVVGGLLAAAGATIVVVDLVAGDEGDGDEGVAIRVGAGPGALTLSCRW